MTIAIDFSPAEEARVTEAAGRAGMPPAELVKRLALEHLREAVNSRDGLRSKWAQNDAAITDEERAEEERIFGEIETHGIPRFQI